MEYLGNQEILKHYKTAFLCSQKCPAEIVLNSYDWAKEQRKQGTCVVCGNHSQIEKDVFDILLKGNQPLILVLARGMKSQWSSPIMSALNNGRLLVVSPFEKSVKRVTRATAEFRNKYMIELAQKVHAAYAANGGMLERLLSNQKNNRPIINTWH